MQDIFEWYRKGLLFYGPYRAYFGKSRQPFSEYIPKTQYSGERLHSRSEPERKEQHNEIKPASIAETKTEIKSGNKNEESQKIETKQDLEPSQKIEKQNEISQNEKVGSPEIYRNEIKAERTDITTRRNRPADYYDRAEMRW